MVAEVAAGIGAFKAMFDMAKALKDMDVAATRNAAVIELQEVILATQAQQTTLANRVSELEEEVRRFETWEAEKQRYELKDVGDGAVAYMLKPNARGPEPPHWLCPNCYQDRKLGHYQRAGQQGRDHVFKCTSCKEHLRTNTYQPEWL